MSEIQPQPRPMIVVQSPVLRKIEILCQDMSGYESRLGTVVPPDKWANAPYLSLRNILRKLWIEWNEEFPDSEDDTEFCAWLSNTYGWQEVASTEKVLVSYKPQGEES